MTSSLRGWGLPLGVLLATALAVFPASSSAQDPDTVLVPAAGDGSQLRVYLDCATRNCDRDRFRREVTFVQWVREPQDGDVHVILTSQGAGAGQQYLFDFSGRGELDGVTDRFTHTSSSTDVEEEVAAALTHTLRLGLVRFMALAGLGQGLEVASVEGGTAARAEQQVPADDPWNFWVFSAGVNAEIEKEDRREAEQYRMNASANRTTEAWKIDLGFFASWQRDEFEVDSVTTVVNEQDDWSADVVVVKSLTDHWSVGASSDVGSSTRFNQTFSVELLPAVEWNYYPWQDASRRRFVVLYAVGGQYVEYEDTTVYGRTEETIWRHRVDIAYRAQETWGNARLGIEGNQVLDRPEFLSLEFQGNINYRLIRGLGLDVGASYEIIRDQLYLSGEGLDPEEILLERRQLQTGSRLSFEVGISYRFGSIFNSFVNSRFPSVNEFDFR